MDLLTFVFEPLNFAGGFAAASAVYGAKALVAKRGNGNILVKAKDVSTRYKQVYAECESLLEDTEEKAASFKHDFQLAFPQAPVPSPGVFAGITALRNVVNGMLAEFTLLDNHHISLKELSRIEKSLADSKKVFSASHEQTNGALQNLITGFKGNMKEYSEGVAFSDKLAERLDVARKSYAKAETVFDKIYLEKIPPALFEAERACERLDNLVADSGYDSSGVYCWVDPSAQTRVEASVRKLENHLTRVLDYSVTAKRQTAKMRQRLRSYPPYTATQTEGYNIALESLMDAESRAYDKGNPVDEFDVATLPYLRYLNDRNKR